MRAEFIKGIESHQEAFGLQLAADTVDSLADYYELVQKANPLLHLVAPCSPEEFAIRHVLESLTLLEFLRENSRFADIGTGAGLPSIPCLIARGDLRGLLIETKEKKSGFLIRSAAELGILDRTVVLNQQFEEVSVKDASHVTCRALDRFVERLPRLLKWSAGRPCLFFGGNALEEALKSAGAAFNKKLLPLSERRYLFSIARR